MNISNNSPKSLGNSAPLREPSVLDKFLDVDPNFPKLGSLDALFGKSPNQPSGPFDWLLKPQNGGGVIDQVFRKLKFDTPTRLEAFANAPSKLETIAAQPSFQIAQVRDGDRRTTITQEVLRYTPNSRGGTATVHRDRIRIEVRVLRVDELGSLAGKSGQSLKNELSRASAQIDRENRANSNGLSTAKLRALSDEQKYYNSPAHKAWAKAAEARTGGKIPADWWIKNDPFGGTAGNGSAVILEGKYPGVFSKIAMAHETDWTLGRVFSAGPLRALADSNRPQGAYGLHIGPNSRADVYRADRRIFYSSAAVDV